MSESGWGSYRAAAAGMAVTSPLVPGGRASCAYHLGAAYACAPLTNLLGAGRSLLGVSQTAGPRLAPPVPYDADLLAAVAQTRVTDWALARAPSAFISASVTDRGFDASLPARMAHAAAISSTVIMQIHST